MNEHALKVLEFPAILALLARHCETPLGTELAASITPLWDACDIWEGLALTEEALRAIGIKRPPSLAGLRDVRSCFELASKGGVLGPSELFATAECLAVMRQLRVYVSSMRDEAPRLWRIAEHLPSEPKVEEAIFRSIEPDGAVRDSASPELARIRQKMHTTQARIMEKIQGYVSGRARDLLSDPIYTIRDGRYVVPLKAEHRGKIKGIVHDTSGTGQTLFIEPEDVLQLGNALRELESAERDEIERILARLSERVGSVAEQAAPGVESASHLDLALAKARLAEELDGSMPETAEGRGIALSGARHPLLDRKTVVPLTIELGWERPAVLITGPNTGGKTVAIKLVGLCVVMAQAGLLPPARSCRLGPFSQVWADIGDEQSIQQSLSTFSGHIKNIAEALSGLREGALVLLDEIGAGTDPAEGAALAKAILMAFQKGGATLLASTHYGELKAFAYNARGFENAAMEFDSQSLKPTYRLMMGMPGASHALKIAERCGMPWTIIEEARAGLSPEFQDVAQMLERLEEAERRSELAQSEADSRARELERLQEQADHKLREADEIRRKAHAQAGAAIDEALREIRLEAARLFEELKAASGDTRSVERVREDLKALQALGEETAQRFRGAQASSSPPQALKKGQTVRIEGYAQLGTLLDDPKGEEAAVQMGPLRLTVSISRLSAAYAPIEAVKGSRRNLSLEKAMTAHREIHLRSMRAEDAALELEKFLDDAVLAGLDQVRIVHGKGGGVLRQITQDYLRRHPHVRSYRDADSFEGGSGVTIAVLK